ncbi:MAG: methyltransferase domain-containing protein [Anaerolineales bacterium]|nr:methyltransferase domain-containing protein [Anaerolineales bacterium]
MLVCQAEGLQNRYSDLIQTDRVATDGGLTAAGWEQANLLAQWLQGHERIDAIYCAPLLRSRLTAQRLGQALNLPVTVYEGLPGRIPAGVPLPESWDPLNRSILQQMDVDVDPASPYAVYLRQLVQALDEIVLENYGKTFILVVSGNGVASAVRHFCGAHSTPVAVCHTGITEFRRLDGAWYLMYVNRREHLPAPPLTQPGVRVNVTMAAAPDDHAADLAAVGRTYARLSPSEVELRDLKDLERLQRIRHLLKFAQLRPEMAVLDVGTGAGQLALMVAEEGAKEVVGVDVSPVMLEVAEYMRLRSGLPDASRVSFRLAPAHAMPFRDERFDAVITRLLLHHSHRPQDLVAEVTRLLMHGGVYVLADLLSADDPVKRATLNAIEEKRNPSHVAARSADQYRKLVVGAGLIIETEQTVTFEREFEDWLNEMQVEPAVRTMTREMIEAGLETDAAGISARRRGDKLVFEQRMFYLRARKP